MDMGEINRHLTVTDLNKSLIIFITSSKHCKFDNQISHFLSQYIHREMHVSLIEHVE